MELPPFLMTNPSVSFDFGAWIQSPLGATIVGGLIVTALGGAVTGVVARAKKIQYRELWVRIGRWVRGSWPVTTRRYERDVAGAHQRGVDAEKAKIAAEREVVPQPYWYVNASRFDDPDRLMLFNSGYAAWDVSVTADPELLVLEGEVFFRGAFGSDSRGAGTGKHFGAIPTDKAKAEGAVVQITWRDKNQDRHTRDVHVPASVFARALDAALESKFQDGRRAGLAEAFEEQEARRTQFVEEIRWNMIRLSGSGEAAMLVARQPEQAFRLRNSASGSTARNVKVSAKSQFFQFSEGGQWVEVKPKTFVDFKGLATNGAGYSGLDFSVVWIDDQGESHSAEYHVDGWESGVY